MDATSSRGHPGDQPDAGAAGRRPVREPLALGADLLAVLLFVVLGRRTHDEDTGVDILTGTAVTAWPFLTGTALGWAVVQLAARTGRDVHPASLRGGLAVLVATVSVGMTLRRLTGGGVQASFVAVATTVLALLLLGWRAAAARRS